eukprot:6596999-Prymnesium_polylepis.1
MLLEASDLDPEHADVVLACRRLTAALRSGAAQRIRPPRFSSAEAALLTRLRAAHCDERVTRLETLAPVEEAALGAPWRPHPALPSGRCTHGRPNAAARRTRTPQHRPAH